VLILLLLRTIQVLRSPLKVQNIPKEGESQKKKDSFWPLAFRNAFINHVSRDTFTLHRPTSIQHRVSGIELRFTTYDIRNTIYELRILAGFAVESTLKAIIVISTEVMRSIAERRNLVFDIDHKR